MARRLISGDDAGAVLPAALPALTELRSRGLTHRWVRHVRSSQAFALSLFAPLPVEGVRRTMALLNLHVAHAQVAEFEFEDVRDRLSETSARSPHRTQVDVVLRGITQSGARVAAFIEVKLSELDFGSCSAFASPANPTRANCTTPGVFGSDPSACFQLLNHGLGRRQYDSYLPSPQGVTGPLDDGTCMVREGLNQPMRNLALAHLMVDEGELEQVVYALCAPVAHPTIWRRYEEFRTVFPDTGQVRTGHLPAEAVAEQHADTGAAFFRRYGPALQTPGSD